MNLYCIIRQPKKIFSVFVSFLFYLSHKVFFSCRSHYDQVQIVDHKILKITSFGNNNVVYCDAYHIRTLNFGHIARPERQLV